MQSHTLSTVCRLQIRGIGYLQYKSIQILAIMSLLDKEGLKVLERQTQYGRVVLSLSVSVPVSVSVIVLSLSVSVPVSVSVWIYVVEGLEALESRTRHGKAWDG